jgi:hypothetical protein
LGIVKLREFAKVYGDVSIGIVFSFALALGVILISLAHGFSVDLHSFLFGNIISITDEDVLFALFLGGAVFLLLSFYQKELMYLSFDEVSAKVSGVPVSKLNTLLIVLTAIMGLSILAITGLGRWGTLVSLAVFSVATGFSFPIQRQVINDAIKDSTFRATFMSIESILDRAVCAGVAYVIALYLSGNRLNELLATSGILTLLLMGALMIMYHYFFNRRSEKYL